MRHLKRLTARTVAALSKPGRHADGGNLYLTITRTAATVSRRWTFMYVFAGKQREAGFGSAAVVTLAQAREKAALYHALLAKGVDPLEAKKGASEAAAARKTFGECAEALIKAKRREWRSEVHAGQWRQTLETFCKPIWGTPVDAVDVAALLGVLTPVWQATPETASRLRGRIEAVLDAARAKGFIGANEANPARWKGHLDHLLAKRTQLSRGHLAAMPYAEVPNFVAKLHEVESIQALALEFLILIAARASEVTGARWSEIDMGARVWTIPASRMKAGREHRVPLSGRAVEIVKKMAAIETGDLVFPGLRRGRPLSSKTLLKLSGPGSTSHGFRSAFRDWCGEETSFPREIAEQALAHATGGAVERAYRRGDALEKRRELMEAWARYLEADASPAVLPFARRR